MASQPREGQTKRAPDATRVKGILQAMAKSRSIAPCAIQVGTIGALADVELLPGEISAVANAAPRRLATFRAGRGCARAALKELGSTELAIPRGPSGAPIWPRGFVGSIAHTNELAAAVAARSDRVSGLGLDIETGEPLDSETLLQIVCRAEELIPGLDPSDSENLQRGKVIFAVKEAVYKLYSPLTATFLEFHDLATACDESTGAFRADLVHPQRQAAAGVRTITGVFVRAEGLIVALASLS
jgi:4'-phosphopantetheinyl transferase EntD